MGDKFQVCRHDSIFDGSRFSHCLDGLLQRSLHAGEKLLEVRVQLGGERIGKGALQDFEELVVFRARQ